MRTWQAHPKQVWWLAFRPDGRVLASCCGSPTEKAPNPSADGFVRLWDPLSGTLLGAVGPVGREKPGQWYPTCLAFSPDSKYLAAAFNLSTGPTRVRVWDVLADPPELAAEFEVEAPALGGLALTAGARALFAADWARVLAFWNVTLAHPGLDPDFAPILLNRGPDRASPKASRVAVSPDDEWVASNGRTRAVVWELPGLKPRHARKHPKSPNNGPVTFAPAGDRLAVAHGTKVDLWTFADKTAPTVELAGHKLPVWGVGFTPDGRGVRTASSDGTVRSWDAMTGRPRGTYDWGLGKLYAAAFAPDGLVGAAGTADGKVVLWDLE